MSPSSTRSWVQPPAGGMRCFTAWCALSLSPIAMPVQLAVADSDPHVNQQDAAHIQPPGQLGATFCGSPLKPEEGIRARAALDRGMYQLRGDFGEQVVVTVAWHVLEDWYGHTAIDQATLDQYLALANEAWEPAGIRLAAHPVIDRIMNDDWFESVPSVNDFRSIRPLENALNIYWAPAGSMGSLCGISAFTFSTLDTIAIQAACQGYSDVGGVFCHEVGHWFDLFHTHEPAYGLECVDGSNCLTSADLLCDTPADFGLSFESCVDPVTCSLREGCDEIYGPCEDDPFYAPDTENFMSYSAVPCMSRFTEDAHERMRATALNLRTSYLNTNLHHPCPSDVNGDLWTNVNDVLQVIAEYGTRCDAPCPTDVDGDGVVNVGDILSILASYGPCFECLSEGDCDDGDPYTFDRCYFGTCVHEPLQADCCLQGNCIVIPVDLCESVGGVSVFDYTACHWTCGRGDVPEMAQAAHLGVNAFTNEYASAGDTPVDESQCPDSQLNWGDALDVWFRLNLPSDGIATFSLCSPGSFDTSLIVYQGLGDGTELVQIGCNGDAEFDDSCQSGYSSLTLPVLDADGYIFVRIGGRNGASGVGELSISLEE